MLGRATARIADVGQHLDVAVDLAVWPVDGLHRAAHPGGLAVLAVQAHLQALDAGTLRQALVDAGDDGAVGVRAAEQFFRQLPVALGQAEAREAREGRVDPADAALRVADQDGVGDAVSDQRQFLVGGLGALQGGLQLAHQLGLLLERVLAHMEFIEQALRIVRHGLGHAQGQ